MAADSLAEIQSIAGNSAFLVRYEGGEWTIAVGNMSEAEAIDADTAAFTSRRLRYEDAVQDVMSQVKDARTRLRALDAE